jgi:50S ribosomal subunit-associated GTPase HflX
MQREDVPVIVVGNKADLAESKRNME